MEPDQSAGTMLNEMSLSVLLFASYADAFGTRQLSVPVQPPCTVADIVAAMRRLPGGEKLPPRPLVALNQEWLQDHAATVQATDELAVIPPVAGG
jgi:molybdopterin converting factor small subunit